MEDNASVTVATSDGIFHQRVRSVYVRNFKSIALAEVQLQPLTFLVGPNASGKSNFLDALAFLSDALDSSLENALRDRGGINEVRRRSGGHPTHFSVGLRADLASNATAIFGIEIAAGKRGTFVVAQEQCRVYLDGTEIVFYLIRKGELIRASFKQRPSIPKDRFYLTKVLAEPHLDALYSFITSLRFYDLNPGEIKDLQPPDVGDALAWDGWNAASVWRSVEHDYPEIKNRLQDYLAQISSEIAGVQSVSLGPKETLQFLQRVSGAEHPWSFYALSMSEGTIRAFGVLLALFQPESAVQLPFVGIEEPERGIHPAAMGVLLDAMREASEKRQILATSHSPDLLDRDDISADSMLAVSAQGGRTSIGPVNEIGRSILRDRLYTAGELLRMNQLEPEAQ